VVIWWRSLVMVVVGRGVVFAHRSRTYVLDAVHARGADYTGQQRHDGGESNKEHPCGIMSTADPQHPVILRRHRVRAASTGVEVVAL
jgi:hypothetical protein